METAYTLSDNFINYPLIRTVKRRLHKIALRIRYISYRIYKTFLQRLKKIPDDNFRLKPS